MPVTKPKTGTPRYQRSRLRNPAYPKPSPQTWVNEDDRQDLKIIELIQSGVHRGVDIMTTLGLTQYRDFEVRIKSLLNAGVIECLPGCQYSYKITYHPTVVSSICRKK